MEDPRQLEHRVKRLEHLLHVYRWCLVLACAMLAGVLIVMLFGKSTQSGRAILIDNRVAAMVRNEKAAAEVRRRLLAAGGGDSDTPATFREKWEDATRPAEGAQILSVNEAVRALQPKVTVVVEAYAVEAAGQRLLVVPSREVAEGILNKLKARYASQDDAVVRQTRLTPEPTLRPITAPPDQRVADIMQGVERLATAHATPRTHTVSAGEYPERIAARYGMSVSELYRLNPGLRGDALHVGRKLNVLGPGAGLTVVTVKETVSTEITTAPVVRQATTSLAPGAIKTVQAGKPGRKRVRWEITMHNEREVQRRVLSEEVIAEPQPKHVLVGAG